MPLLPKKHTKTLKAVFEKPTRSDLKFSAVLSLLKRLGADVDEKRAGSRIAFALEGRVFVLHKPHPRSEMSKGSVEALRTFLSSSGIRP